ncbi:MAG: hypothetical protein WDN28_15540 [Chthoniobacter sp.]
MITDNPTRLPEPPARGTSNPRTRDSIGLLTRIYREAGLSTEAARRCALADFRCSFPPYLGGV